jgi:hypothetical protein
MPRPNAAVTSRVESAVTILVHRKFALIARVCSFFLTIGRLW